MPLNKFADENYSRFEQMCQDTPEILDNNQYTVLRIDGSNFHTYARPFFRPYDPILHIILDYAYEHSFNYILNKNWECWYSQSDEVTVVIPPVSHEKQTIPYGKKSKLVSLLPSYISSTIQRLVYQFHENALYLKESKVGDLIRDLVFSDALLHFNWTDTIKTLAMKKNQSVAFDARLFQTPDVQDVKDVLTWRRIDAITNSKSAYAQYIIGKKKITGMSNVDRLGLLKTEYNYDWFKLPTFIKRGVFMERKTTENYDFNPPDEMTKAYKDIILSLEEGL